MNENDKIIDAFIEEQKNAPVVNDFIQKNNELANAQRYETDFAKEMAKANTETAKRLTADDKGAVAKKMTDSIGKAITQTAENERLRAQYDAEILNLQNIITQNEKEIENLKLQKTDYDKKREKRKYVYEGLAPVLEMVGITKPSSLLLMWVLTCCLFIPYLFWKLFRGIFITPLTGMNPDERKRLAKGYMWTILILAVTIILAVVVMQILSHYGFIK